MKASLIALCLATAAVVGCDDETTTPTNTTHTGNKVENAAEKTGDALKNAADKTGEALKTGAEKTGEALDKAANKAVEAGEKAKNAMTTDSTEAKAEAEGYMAQIKTYIAERKWSDADAAMAKLEALKPKLPATMGQTIDALKANLTQVKAAAQNMPAVPGLK